MSDQYIEKIHLLNFKGFQNWTLENLDSGMNILIGDNDTGKSSVLLAIDLVLSANTGKVETVGLERLINRQAVQAFLKNKERRFEDLPRMEVDIYLSELGRHEFAGEYNIERTLACGMCLICEPKTELVEEISELIALENPAFPYEYYTVEIRTFSGMSITPYKKPLQHLDIDNTKISNDYASRVYVQTLFRANVSDTSKHQLKYGYRRIKEDFAREQFADINEELEEDFGFALKSGTKANLETDLTIARSGLDIENLGVGHQCFIRTKFALSKKSNIDVVLLEEPENHLSHTNMRRLIEEIRETSQSQVFVATHSSLVSTRLDLRHAIMLTSFENDPLRLNDLPKDTAEYFMKAPSNSVLEYVLSPKSLLVEGDAEYILMEELFMKSTGNNLAGSGIEVISVGGISFPRYLDIGKLLGIRTAVVTDNDGDVKTNCIDRYEDYTEAENIEIYCDPDNARSTFEICMYQDNTAICDALFAEGRKTLSVQEYMLKNKSKVAFELVKNKSGDIDVPDYINNAITWLKN
ncbi:MAG: AAA family ATPase [Candidatus Thiodiazotropha sp.]